MSGAVILDVQIPKDLICCHIRYLVKQVLTPSLFFNFQAIFRCSATANPPVYDNSYKWYIDDKLVNGQFGFYFKISNVTRYRNL